MAVSRTKKIAVLLPDLRGGGAERMRVNMSREWLAKGLQVEFVVMRAKGELLSVVPEQATIIELGSERIRDIFGPLRVYLQQHRPDALLVAMWPLTVVAVLVAKLSRFQGRVVISDHEPLSKSAQARGWFRRMRLSASMALAYRLADERIAVSRGVAEDLTQLSRIPRDRFTVIYNPAASGKVPGTIKPIRRIDGCKKLILSVGTLKYEKDHASLIEAFALLPQELNAHLMILGDGNQRDALEALVGRLGLEDRVHLPGFKLDPSPYFASADLFVLSSLWEGFGNVIVEAMEYGVPVVSTDCPHGPREILVGGVYGRLVPEGDVNALALGIHESLLTEHDSQALMQRAADFSVGRIAEQYLRLMFPE